MKFKNIIFRVLEKIFKSFLSNTDARLYNKNKTPSELNTFWRCFIILKRNNFFYPISHNSRNDKIELILVLIFHLKCYGSAELFTCYCVYESLFYPLGLILFYYPYFYWCREELHVTNGISSLLEQCILLPKLNSLYMFLCEDFSTCLLPNKSDLI